MFRTLSLAAAFALIASSTQARLDLQDASVERLDNGLTLIMLEDRTFPVVSVQTTYRTGARDDPAERLGLAHFFEHMAFRGAKHFPDLGLTSEIYAIGGEWHGYTWIDTTNYFATVPKDDLPLLLDVDADRMAQLELRKEDIEAERGAVLAEMNGYANDPDSTLFDALMAAHFMTHPYRNNTIGYPSDIAAITHEDVVDFYERNYAPQNSVIAIVGDIDRDATRALVKRKFGKIRKKVRLHAPLTMETPRTGERRVTISLPADEKLFKIAYPAPAASHPDFPAFLVLQALIGDSAGVNFNQNDWGTPVGETSSLGRIDVRLNSWIIPTADSYAFVISGAVDPKAETAKIEAAIQSAFDRVADKQVSPADLAAAKSEVLTALAFDVETTEDAAHQLASFAGIGALDQFLELDRKIDAIAPDDIARIAAKYLKKENRTIAWLEPGGAPPQAAELTAKDASARDGASASPEAAPAPVEFRTPRGAPILFQRSALSPTISATALLGGRYDCGGCVADSPIFGLTSIRLSASADKADEILATLAATAQNATPIDVAPPASDDPLTRIEEIFAAMSTARGHSGLIAAAVSGDTTQDMVRAFAEDMPPAAPAAPAGFVAGDDVEIILGQPKAQHAVGYAAAAPGAAGTDALAMRIALYVLSHGYSGRLGVEAISRRGLAYYIDALYRAGAGSGLVTIAAGVDPDKVEAFRDLMKAEIARLATEPPTDAEIAEAKRHLLGRKISAAQSNEEIADALIADFLAVDRPESADEFAARQEKATRADVLKAVQTLQKGAVVTVRGAGLD